MIELWYRFNFLGEQRFFKEKSLIDGLIVPAHLIAFFSGTLPSFIRDINIPTLIDPMTYVWNIDVKYILKEGRLKKSYEKYVEYLNNKIANILGYEKINIINEESPDFHEFIDSVLKFQITMIQDITKPRRKSLERIRKHKKRTDISLFKLYGLIPPYFYFSHISEDSYKKTIYSANYSKKLKFKDKYRIIPCLCFDRTILYDDQQKNRIIEDLSDFQEVILWIDDFDEKTASGEEIQGLIDFITKFAEKRIQVMNFYGGYLSLILGYLELSKFSCGICVSDHKSVFSVPGGGGLPIRYYEGYIKRKLTSTLMIRLYSNYPYLFNCECPFCGEYREIDKDLDSVIKRENYLKDFFGVIGVGGKIEQEGIINWETSRLHFLLSRKTEQKNTYEKTIEESLLDLRSRHSVLKNAVDPFIYGSIDHLELWVNCIDNFILS